MARTPVKSDQFQKNKAMIERGRQEFQKLAASLPTDQQIHYTMDASANPRLQAFNKVMKKRNLRHVN